MKKASLGHSDAPADYAAALACLGHRFRAPGILAIEGPDREAFLQGQLTQDARGLAPGQSRPMAGLTPKGKLLYFGRLAAQADRLLLLVPAADRVAIAGHLRKYAVFQKVSVSDVSDEFVLLGLYGPASGQIPAPEGALALPADGEFAAGLLAPAGDRAALEDLLERAGSASVSNHSAEIFRVEAGRPRFGTDADENNLPDEVGLQSAISTTKGCYVGQEIVARLRTYGRVNRRLTGFRFPEEPVPAGTVFSDPGKENLELGRVTSSVVSPQFGPIGLGFTFRDVAEGGVFRLPADPGRCAVVAALPFA
jgi:folate-binding protein YgfZ